MDVRTTSASLLLKLRDFRDQATWDAFVELYGPLILRTLIRIGVPSQDAVDLVNDVLVIILRHIHAFEYDPSKSFRAWLSTVTRNRAYRFFRQQGRQPRACGGTDHAAAIEEIAEPDTEDDLLESQWRRRRLEIGISRLRQMVTPTQWTIFQLLVVEQVPVAEICRRLDMKQGALYTAKSRLLKRLRDELEQIDD